eukprot:1637108-Amphidinium_carterae.1
MSNMIRLTDIVQQSNTHGNKRTHESKHNNTNAVHSCFSWDDLNIMNGSPETPCQQLLHSQPLRRTSKSARASHRP